MAPQEEWKRENAITDPTSALHTGFFIGTLWVLLPGITAAILGYPGLWASGAACVSGWVLWAVFGSDEARRP